MPGPLAHPPLPATAQAATDTAVKQAVSTPAAQSISGTVATVGATPVGAIGMTVGHNLGFSAIGNAATDSPEIPGLAWLTTFLFQGAKASQRIHQSRWLWWLLPAIAFLVGVVVWSLTTHGDYPLAIAKAIQNAGLVAINAATNFKTAQPLGILGPAETQ